MRSLVRRFGIVKASFASALAAPSLFNHLHKGTRLGEGVVGAGVKPGESAAKGLHLQLAIAQEPLVDPSTALRASSGNLILASCGGLDVLGNVYHLVGVKIESHNGIVGLGVLRLFLDGEAVAVFIKLTSSSSFAPRQYSSAGLILLSVWRRFSNAITLGVGYPIAEDCGFLVLLGCTYRLLEH